MPFQSEKQRRWMHANRPDLAKKFASKAHREALLRRRKGRLKKTNFSSTVHSIKEQYSGRERGQAISAAAKNKPKPQLAVHKRPVGSPMPTGKNVNPVDRRDRIKGLFTPRRKALMLKLAKSRMKENG